MERRTFLVASGAVLAFAMVPFRRALSAPKGRRSRSVLVNPQTVSVPTAVKHVTILVGGGPPPAGAPGTPTGVAIESMSGAHTFDNAKVFVTFTPADSLATWFKVTLTPVLSGPPTIVEYDAWSPVGSQGLWGGWAYTATVVAVNDEGESAPSSPSASFTPTSSPDIIAITDVTTGNGQLTAHFVGPDDDGGSAVLGYEVADTHQANRQGVTGSSSPLTLTGLANGVAVSLVGWAFNVVGNGIDSSRSMTVTPSATVVPAGAPTIGTATAGSASATVAWTAPGSDGGSAITGWQVRVFRASDNGLVKTVSLTGGGLTSGSIGGLANGVGVYFKVAAITAVGVGTYSGASNTIVPVAGGAETIWPGGLTPSQNSSSNEYTLGTRFTVAANGNITALRFYQTAGMGTGTVTCKLWRATSISGSVEIGSASTSITSGTPGWRTATLSTPVAVVPGERYVTSFHLPAGGGGFPHAGSYFASAHDSGNLTATQNNVPIGYANGLYIQENGVHTFPANSSGADGYFADVVFEST